MQAGKEPHTKDLTLDKMYILHPLSSFVVIMPDQYRLNEGEDMYVTFVPLVESSVKALGLKNVKYPFWHRSDMSIWFSISVTCWTCVKQSDSGNGYSAQDCVVSFLFGFF